MNDKEKTLKKEEIYESILEKDSVEFRKLMMRFINDINEEIGDEIEKELIYRNKDSLPQAQALNKKVKKLKYKIEWLRLELEEVREVNAKCLERFFQDFAEVLTEDIEEKVVETLPEKKSFHAAEHVTSKLFKEIAVKTHPDKSKSKD